MKKKIFAFVTMLSFLFLIMAGYLSHVSGEEKERENIRPPAVAGTFYPGSPAKLRESITELLDSVPQVTPAGEILAAVAPHAGYTYSGEVAAYTHKRLSTVQFDTLMIIGHDTYRNAVAFTCPVDYFQAPKNCQILSDAILAAAGSKTVFVLASADMSHYVPYETARKCRRIVVNFEGGVMSRDGIGCCPLVFSLYPF